MASSHIEISGSATRENAQLRSNVDALQRYMDDSARFKALLDSASLDSDWTSLGALLGVNATDAETIYNLFVGMWNTLVNNGAIQQYLSRLG